MGHDGAPAPSAESSALTLLPSGLILVLQFWPSASAQPCATGVLRCDVYHPDSSPCSAAAVSAPAGMADGLQQHGGLAVIASHAAVAVFCEGQNTSPHAPVVIWVYELHGCSTVGRLLSAEPNRHIQFSPGGHFLAGIHDNTVCVFEVATGSQVMAASPCSTWAGPHASQCWDLEPEQALWHHSQLVVNSFCHSDPAPEEGSLTAAVVTSLQF